MIRGTAASAFRIRLREAGESPFPFPGVSTACLSCLFLLCAFVYSERGGCFLWSCVLSAFSLLAICLSYLVGWRWRRAALLLDAGLSWLAHALCARWARLIDCLVKCLGCHYLACPTWLDMCWSWAELDV